MEEVLYIIVYRRPGSNNGWSTGVGCVFEGPQAQLEAYRYCEYLRHRDGPGFPASRLMEYAVVRGPITSPAQMAEAEAQLG